MASHVTVVPASTRPGREAIRALLAHPNGPHIRAVYRDTAKAPPAFSANTDKFRATTGDVGIENGNGLDLTGSDTVFYIPPPVYDGRDEGAWATEAANHVKAALEKPGVNVQRLVILSAVGAQHEHGIGIIRLNHISDEILKTAAPEVVIARPSYFMEYFAPLIEEAAATSPPSFRSWIAPPGYKIPIISTRDIGEACAECMRAPLPAAGTPKGSSLRDIKLFGPRPYGATDLRDAVAASLGRPSDEVEVQLVAREQLYPFFAEHVPEPYVQELVDMTVAGFPGGVIAEDWQYDDNTVIGQVELVDAFRAMAQGAH